MVLAGDVLLCRAVLPSDVYMVPSGNAAPLEHAVRVPVFRWDGGV